MGNMSDRLIDWLIDWLLFNARWVALQLYECISGLFITRTTLETLSTMYIWYDISLVLWTVLIATTYHLRPFLINCLTSIYIMCVVFNIAGMWHSSNIYVSSYRATCLFDECQIIGKGLVCTPQLCCLDIRSTSIELNNVSSDITKQKKK
jgi:hypothetical protein